MPRRQDQIVRLLADVLLLGGDQKIAVLLSKFLMSKSSLWKHYCAMLVKGKVAAGDRLLSNLGGYLYGPNDYVRFESHLSNLQNGIAIYGFFRAESGLGASARRSARSLQTTSVRISLHNLVDAHNFENIVDFDASDKLTSNLDTALIHLNADSLLNLLPQLPPHLLVRRRRIGYWHWELPVFPPKWAPAFKLVHEVWAPSRHVADLLSAASDIPVKMVPHAAEATDIDASDARTLLGLPATAFVFLTIFDTNSYVARKNPLGVIRAFQDAFPLRTGSDHLLVVKYHGRNNRGPEFDELLRLAASDRRIVLIDKLYSEQQVRVLQAACDVYVSLHRAEGFGLNIIECMAEGKLAIATAFSGNTDFMSDENSLLVPFKMKRVLKGEYLHGEGQWWADPDHDAAVEALRMSVDQAVSARRREQARRDIAAGYSFEAVGKLSAAAWNDGGSS